MKLPSVKPVSATAFFIGVGSAVLGLAVSAWFFIPTILGFLLPILLRYLGVLHDYDEFELESMKTGVFYSFLSTGVIGSIYLVGVQTQLIGIDISSLLYFLLLVQVFAYFMARYYHFWMNPRAGRLILGVLLVFWSLFVILSSESFIGFVMEGLVVLLPPIVLVLLSLRWPVFCGVLCFLLGIFTMFFFDVFNDNPFVFVLLSIPVMLAGAALLGNRRTGPEKEAGPGQDTADAEAV